MKLNSRNSTLPQQPIDFVCLCNLGHQNCFDRRRQGARYLPCNSSRNKVRAIMSLADQETDSISAELSRYQGIFVSSYSTNLNRSEERRVGNESRKMR